MFICFCIIIWIGCIALAHAVVPAEVADREMVVAVSGLLGGLVLNLALFVFGKAVRAFKNAYFTVRLCDTWLGRKLVGFLYHLAALFFGFAVTAPWLFRPDELWSNRTLLWVASALLIKCNLHRVLGIVFAPVQILWRSLRMGLGGSSLFAGMLQEWRTLYRKGSLYLGRSLYSRGWHVGYRAENSIVTVASTGAGKGRCSIIINLLLWVSSLLMIDPKGTNAYVSARARHRLSYIQESVKWYVLNLFVAAPVRFALSFWPRSVDWDPIFDRLPPRAAIIDPYHEIKGPAERFCTGINLLAGLDPNNPHIANEIDDIALALTPPSSAKEPIWDEGGQHITGGCIGLALSKYGKGNFTLLDVRDFLLMDKDALLEAMLEQAEADTTLARVILGGATPLMTGSKEAAAYLQVARRNTNWLDSEAMASVLMDQSDEHGLHRLKSDIYSIYLVIPPHMLETSRHFLRLFTTAVVREMTRPPRSKRPVLLCLDEAYALKKLPILQVAASLGRSYKLVIWSIYQNLGQLVENYGRDNFEIFLSAAGCLQIFGINDKFTEEYFGSRIGHHIVEGKIHPLRLPQELERQTGREERSQIILRSGKDPLLLGMSSYDRMFWRGSYDYDPDFVSASYYPACKRSVKVEADCDGDNG